MKITASAGELAGALALAASLCDDRLAKTRAALAAVRITATADTITVTTNALDQAVALTVPAQIMTPGAMAVSAAKLSALAASFQAKADLEIMGDGTIARVTCGRSHYKLATVPLDTMPDMLKITDETGRTEVERADLRELLGRVVFAISTEQKTRHYLCGIVLHDVAGGLVACCTDGYRLARAFVPGPAGLSQDRSLIVPAPAIRIVRRLLAADKAEHVTLRRSRSLIAVETPAAVFVSTLIDAVFPDYARLVPPPSGNAVAVLRADLMQALDRLAAVADGRSVAGLRWTSDEPVLRLCLADIDAAEDVVVAEVTGNGTVAARLSQLQELCGVLDSKRVHLDARSGSDPIVVTDPDDKDFTGLQMPCTWSRAARAA